MTAVNLLEKLKLSGITVISEDNPSGIIIECVPSYRENFGFFHITGSNFEAIILKGVYKDFLRILKGNPDISMGYWDSIAKTLNDSESAVGYCKYKIALSAEEARVFYCEKFGSSPKYKRDFRDYKIPRPLTSTEYIAATSSLYDENVILSQKFLNSIFSDTLTPLSVSILEKIQNVLNPIFMSCNLKTDTPSVVNLYARPYTNLTALEKLLKTIGIGSSIFRQSFAPNLYIAKATTPNNIIKKYFPVEDDEITEILEELKNNIENINTEVLVEDKYVEFHVNFAILAEFLFIKFADLTSLLLKYFTDYSSLLKAVYRTRETSIFYTENPLNLPIHFDYNTTFKEVALFCEKSNETIENHIKKLPFSKKFMAKGKIKKLIKEFHKYLNLRDDVYLTATKFLEKSKSALDNISDFAIKKELIQDKDDIYYLEHSELKKLLDNSFFGDINQTITFRKRLYYRYAAQIIPTEIYGSDLMECAKISESMVTKSLSQNEYKVLSLYFKENIEAICKSNNNDNFSNDDFVVSSSISICDIEKYKNIAGFILESNSLFSFLSEYAAIKEIPIFYGVRFAPLVLDNVKVNVSQYELIKL